MLERASPLYNRPDDDTQGHAPSDAQIEKRVREELDLRLSFVAAVARVKKISVSEALKEYSDFYKRITNKWPDEMDKEAQEKWDKFSHLLEGKTRVEQENVLFDIFK